MSPTAIEWTEETWNPVTGCTKVSAGCDNCYAERITNRFGGPGAFDTIELHPDRLEKPLRWKKPRTVFVNSMSDLFHADVPAEFISDVFDVMGATPHHTYQVLTKRPGRMREWIRRATSGTYRNPEGLLDIHPQPTDALLAEMDDPLGSGWPLPNVWLGVSVENQQTADARIPVLLDTPAAVRFLSCEPLLGPMDLRRYLVSQRNGMHPTGLDWVIVGGESGPHARPMQEEWARSLRDQCMSVAPFFFKQWGGRTPKANGRELDGRTWDEMPP